MKGNPGIREEKENKKEKDKERGDLKEGGAHTKKSAAWASRVM